MKARDMKDLSAEELSQKAAELREASFNLRLKHRAGLLAAQTADLKKTRRDLARVLTIQRARAAEAKSAGKPGAGTEKR